MYQSKPFFLETMCIQNGNIQLFQFHVQRIARTAAAFGLSVTVDMFPECLHNLLRNTEVVPDKKMKARFVYSDTINDCTVTPYVPKQIQSVCTISADIEYPFKYADRSELNNILQKVSCDEIIIEVNGWLTDSSFSNIALYDGSTWHTPTKSLLAGVKQTSLLQEGMLIKTEIKNTDLRKFEKLCFINAMLDLGELCIDIKNIETNNMFLRG